MCALQTLPRQLWELRSSAASTSLLMLRMLHSAGACAQAQAEQDYQRCEACGWPAGTPLFYMPGNAETQGMLAI